MSNGKRRWIHYCDYPDFLRPLVAVCGKKITHEMCYPQDMTTTDENRVTCKRCKEELGIRETK